MRWHQVRRLWRADRELEDCQYFGAKFRVAPNDVIGREMILQRFEWLQIPAMLRACRELRPVAFLDIGANFGLYTCIIGRQGLAERLIAFEPNHWALGRFARAYCAQRAGWRRDPQLRRRAADHTAVLLPGAPWL